MGVGAAGDEETRVLGAELRAGKEPTNRYSDRSNTRDGRGARTPRCDPPPRAHPPATARRREAQRVLQSEALRVHGVLLHACGRYFFHHAKLFCAPHLLPDAASPAEAAATAAAAAASAAAAAAAASKKGHAAPAADPARQAASTAAAAAAAAELLPQIAIGYDDLHAQFGDALLPYTRTSVSARPDARSLADLFL